MYISNLNIARITVRVLIQQFNKILNYADNDRVFIR